MNVLMTYDYGEKTTAIEALGYKIHYAPETAAHQYPYLNEIDLLVCYNPFQTLKLSQMPRLKGIFLSSIGIDQLPIDEVLNRGIAVANNRGGYSPAIAEWIVFRLLSIYKRARAFDQLQHEKKWRLQTDIEEIGQARICFIGAGSIAKRTSQLLKPFGATIIGVNTSGSPVAEFDEVYGIDRLDAILPQCDAVVITIPYTERTHRLIDSRRLRLLKRDCVVINVSRGKIMDESALIQCLEEGYFKGVALDVFDEEPLIESSPLWNVDRVYLSPHNAWVSQYRNERRFETLLKNLEAFINQQPLFTPVDAIKGY